MEGIDFQPTLARAARSAARSAAATLSGLLYEATTFRAPRIYHLTSPDMLLTRLKAPRRLVSVTRPIDAPSAAKLSLAVGSAMAATMAARLMGRRGQSLRHLGSAEMDALKEAADIVAGSYAALLAPALGIRALPAEPSLMEGSPAELVPSFLPRPGSLCVEARLQTLTSEIEVLLLIAVGWEGGDQQGRRAARLRAATDTPQGGRF